MTLTTYSRCSCLRVLPGIILLLLTSAAPLWAADEAKRVVALIDYIGGDYRNAVQEGKIVNSDACTEIPDFSARSL